MKLTSLFDPLRQAATAFFKHDLALRRDAGTREVKIVLEQRAPKKGAKPTREELAQRREREELALMRAQLAELLDTMPETRAGWRTTSSFTPSGTLRVSSRHHARRIPRTSTPNNVHLSARLKSTVTLP